MDIEDFNLAEGERVAVKGLDGKILYGVIKHFEHDKVTGEVRISVE